MTAIMSALKARLKKVHDREGLQNVNFGGKEKARA